MSYIIARITENAIDIIDDENGIKFETGTLENIIKTGKKDFYYKFIVDECIEDDDDCFQLTNLNRYKINFDSKDFKQKVNDDFLSIGNASAKVAAGPDKVAEPKGAESKVAESKVEKMVHNFNKHIVDQLQKLVPPLKNTDAAGIMQKNKNLVPKFNQRILEELKKLTIKSNVIEETKAIQPIKETEAIQPININVIETKTTLPITSAEFNKLTDENNKFVDNMGPIQEKLTTFKNTQTINHSIDMQKYEQIYVTSDIHADVRKFLQLLIKEKIISIDNNFDPYNTELGTDFIDTIKFVKPKTLLIILGDLIDGKRNGNSVDDKVGNFEILLHVILFNMRISAKSMNSDVLFTLGNHDLENIYGRAKLMTYYAHSINYFGDYSNYKKNIATALRPFYELSPYIMLYLQNNNDTKYIGIHAGIHESLDNNKEKTMLPDLEKMQKEINSKGLRDILTNQDDTDLSDNANNTLVKPNRLGGDGGLWTRLYAEGNFKCDAIETKATILVGHCTTHTFINRHLNKDAVGNYDNCLIQTNNEDPEKGKKGCALAICPDTSSNGRPKVILVDTMMSCAFYEKNYDNKNRNHEFILLKKDSIYRKPTGENEILVWEPSVGSKSNKPSFFSNLFNRQ